MVAEPFTDASEEVSQRPLSGMDDLTREAKIFPYCFRNIFSKDADNASANDSIVVELGRCKPLNRVPQLRELNIPINVNSSRSANELVDCSCADLTLDFLADVQH